MEFIAKGSLTLSGVTFYIEAVDLTEAKRKAAAGEYETYEADTASADNWTIYQGSVQEDK